jgi:hypothetical protein
MPMLRPPAMPIVKSGHLRIAHDLGFRTKKTFTYVRSHLSHVRRHIVIGTRTHFEILNSMYTVEFNVLNALCYEAVLLRASKSV